MKPFIIICIVIAFAVVCLLKKKEDKRKAIMKMDEEDIEQYRLAYEEETKYRNSIIGNTFEYSRKAKKYIEYLKNDQITTEYDCAVISAGMFLCAEIGYMILFYGTIDDVGFFIFTLLACSACAILLGVLFGGVVSLIADKVIKQKTKDVRYWLTCCLYCLLILIVACVIFYYGKGYEYEPN